MFDKPLANSFVTAHTLDEIPVYFSKQLPKAENSYPFLSSISISKMLKTINNVEPVDFSIQPPSDPFLWVQKYAPTKFTELLSNERCNIELLQWVHKWSQ